MLSRRPGSEPVALGTVGLTRVLEYGNVMALAEVTQSSHVGHLAIEVNGQQARGALAENVRDRGAVEVVVVSCTSTTTGAAPTCVTASNVAMNVSAGTTTSSPGPTSAAKSASRSASSPLATPTQCDSSAPLGELALEVAPPRGR